MVSILGREHTNKKGAKFRKYIQTSYKKDVPYQLSVLLQSLKIDTILGKASEVSIHLVFIQRSKIQSMVAKIKITINKMCQKHSKSHQRQRTQRLKIGAILGKASEASNNLVFIRSLRIQIKVNKMCKKAFKKHVDYVSRCKKLNQSYPNCAQCF